jgi:hypothetical protein
MKSFAAIIVAALATVAMGTSIPNADAQQLEARALCKHPSRCGAFWSGRCEGWCAPFRFSHMTKGPCGLFQKRCCCRA